MLHKFIISIILLLAGASAVFAQTELPNQDVIKVETTLVSVPVIVSDRQGRYVSGLQAKDFTLFQDGTKQNIELFTATEEPLNIALLIDTSRSTSQVLGDIKSAAIKFVEQLKPQDKAMIVSFDYQTNILSPLTSDQKELKNAIKHAEIGEYVGTTLREAVKQTIDNYFSKIKGRKAIILLTDGKDHGSEISAPDLIRAVEESETMIYSIFYETGFALNQNNRRDFPFPRSSRQGGIFNRRFPNNNPFPRRRFPDEAKQQNRRQRQEINEETAIEFLQKLADATAGRFYQSKINDLRQTFGLITDELRYQYRLGFYPNETAKNESLHTIKIKVGRDEAVVRARKTYRVKR